MATVDTENGELNHEEINNGDFALRGIWTCNNSHLSGGEEHIMGESEVDTFEGLSSEFGVHYHDNCMECEAYNAHYEGDLDRVEIVNTDGEVVQTVEPEVLVQEYGMVDDYGVFKA